MRRVVLYCKRLTFHVLDLSSLASEKKPIILKCDCMTLCPLIDYIFGPGVKIMFPAVFGLLAVNRGVRSSEGIVV